MICATCVHNHVWLCSYGSQVIPVTVTALSLHLHVSSATRVLTRLWMMACNCLYMECPYACVLAAWISCRNNTRKQYQRTIINNKSCQTRSHGSVAHLFSWVDFTFSLEAVQPLHSHCTVHAKHMHLLHTFCHLLIELKWCSMPCRKSSAGA